MRKYLFLLLCFSCAQFDVKDPAPSWVTAVRSGEEALRINHGSKAYFRRIAGGPNLSKETSCELVVMKAQEDIRKEFQTSDVSHTVEVLFYDHDHRDCAVTISVDAKKRDIASAPVKTAEELSEEAASQLVLDRSEKAIRFALTGLTVEEFEKFSNEKVSLISGESLCQSVFQTDNYSIHGLTHVCWSNNNIEGYCTSRTSQCWRRTPQ